MFITESAWDYPKQLKWLDQFIHGHNGFIAGGFAKNCFQNYKVRDIDMFFYDEVDYKDAVRCFEERDGLYETEYENDNVTAFKHKATGIVVECIRKIYGTPEEILKQFDFTIAKFAFYKASEVSIRSNGAPWAPEGEPEYKDKYYCLYHEKFFEHLYTKRLVIDAKCPYPISTFDRMWKYAKQGFFPCRGTKKRIIEELRALPVAPNEFDVAFYRNDGID